MDPLVQDYMERLERVSNSSQGTEWDDELSLMDRLWYSMSPDQREQTRILTMKLLSERHG
jgi:hypothetical protein